MHKWLASFMAVVLGMACVRSALAGPAALDPNNGIYRVTASGPVPNLNAYINCDATNGNVVLTLPHAIGLNMYASLEKIDSSTNTCSFAATAGDSLEGYTTTLSQQYSYIKAMDKDYGLWYAGGIGGNGGAYSYVASPATSLSPICQPGAPTSYYDYPLGASAYTINLSNSSCGSGQAIELTLPQSSNSASVSYNLTGVSMDWLSNCNSAGACTQPSLSGNGFTDRFRFVYDANEVGGATFFASQQMNKAPIAATTNGGTGCNSPATFATLPGSPTTGTRCTITDATTCKDGATISAGGGGTVCETTYNGTAWVVSGPQTLDATTMTTGTILSGRFPASGVYQTIVGFGSGAGNAGTTTGTVKFMGPDNGSLLATEAEVQVPWGAGTFSNLRCAAQGAPGTSNSYAIVARDNSGNAVCSPGPTCTCSMAGAVTSCVDATDTWAVTAGHQIDLQVTLTVGGSAPAANAVNCSMQFTF